MTSPFNYEEMARRAKEEDELPKPAASTPKFDYEAMAKASVSTFIGDRIKTPVDAASVDLTPRNMEEVLAGRRQRSSESRREFLESTAESRQGALDMFNSSTLEAQPEGLSRIADNILNFRVLKGFPGAEEGVELPHTIVAKMVYNFADKTAGEVMRGNVGTGLWNALKTPYNIAKTFTDPMFAYPGQLAKNMITDDMTAEEKEYKKRAAMGMWGGIAASLLTRNVMGGTATRNILRTGAQEASLSNAQLAQLASMRQMSARWMPGDAFNWQTIGAAEGIVGGLVAGAIEGDEDNKLGLGLTYAFLAAPLGVLFEGGIRRVQVARGKPTLQTRDMASQAYAQDLMAVKSLRATEQFTPETMASAITNAAIDANLVKMGARVALHTNRSIVIDGLTDTKWVNDLHVTGGDARRIATPKELGSTHALFTHPTNGTISALIMPDHQKVDLIPGWHGSGAIFDEIDGGFAHTGEGGQTYGAGDAYFSAMRNIGGLHMRRLKKSEFRAAPGEKTIGDLTSDYNVKLEIESHYMWANRQLNKTGKAFTDADIQQTAFAELRRMSAEMIDRHNKIIEEVQAEGPDHVRKYGQADFDESLSRHTREQTKRIEYYNGVLSVMEQLEAQSPQMLRESAALYEVNFLARDDELLHYGSSFDEQPAIVKRFFREYAEEKPKSNVADMLDTMDNQGELIHVEHLYRSLASDLDPSNRSGRGVGDRAASDLLRSYGIKGNRFTDPLYRDFGLSDKAHNFVVYSKNDLRIAKRIEADGTVTDFTVDRFIDRRADKAIFATAGHIPGERVGYRGKWYTYEGPIFGKDLELTGHKIKTAGGHTLEVAMDDLQRDPALIMQPKGITEGFRALARKTIEREFKSLASPIDIETLNIHKAVGRELAQDLYNPSVLDADGNPALIARAGETFDEAVFNQAGQAGISDIPVTKQLDPTTQPQLDIFTASLDDLVNQFMKEQAVFAHDRPAIYDMFADIMSNEMFEQMLKTLDADEAITFRRLINAHDRYLMQMQDDILSELPGTGHFLDLTEQGLVLHDSQLGHKVGNFNSLQDLRAYLKTLGAPEGPELVPGMDGSGPVPPKYGNSLMDSGSGGGDGPASANWTPRHDTLGRLASHSFNIHTGGRISPIRSYMMALDAIYGPKTAGGIETIAKIWDPLEKAFIQRHAAQRATMERISVISKMARGMSHDEMIQITKALEAVSAKEIEDGLFMQRPMTNREIVASKWFQDNAIDTKKALIYRRELKELMRQSGGESFRGADGKWHAAAAVPPEVLDQMIKELQARHGIDAAHVQAVKHIDSVLKIDKPGELSLLAILEHAEASNPAHPAPTRAEFIAANNMSAKQLRLMDFIEKEYKALGPEFNIPNERMLQRYMARRRMMGEDMPTENRSGRPGEFVHDLMRIGEIVDYEMDPVNALLRYANTGYGKRFTFDAVNKAVSYLDTVAENIPKGGQLIKQKILENFIQEIQGHRHPESAFTGATFKAAFGDVDDKVFGAKFLKASFERVGIHVDDNTVRGLVNVGLSISSSAGVGFRPMQGMRDIASMVTNNYIRFGAKRTKSMLTIMSKMTPQELVEMGILKAAKEGESIPQALSREGITPTMSPIAVEDAAQRQLAVMNSKHTKFRDIVNRTADEGIRWGGQYSAYSWGHSAVYLSTYVDTMKHLVGLEAGKFGEGALAKAKAFDEMMIDTFDRPVQIEFNKLVTEGKYKSAAEFLSRAASFEINYIFGLANSPIGGATSTGRMLSQFGSWSFHERTFLSRVATQGTGKHKAQAIARWAASRAGQQLVGTGLGLDITSWYLMSGAMGFRGGPMASALESVTGLFGNERSRDEAFRNFSRLWMLGIPGSLAMRDWVMAVRAMEEGANPAHALMRGIGVKLGTPDYRP